MMLALTLPNLKRSHPLRTSAPIGARRCQHGGGWRLEEEMPNQHDGKTTEQRFWEKVRITPGCWEWIGAKTEPGGYGQITSKSRLTPAHRFSYKLHKSDIPKGMLV